MIKFRSEVVYELRVSGVIIEKKYFIDLFHVSEHVDHLIIFEKYLLTMLGPLDPPRTPPPPPSHSTHIPPRFKTLL